MKLKAYSRVSSIRLYLKSISALFVFILINTYSPAVYGFKVNTHVWVGQQVLNDLQNDNRVTIPINGNVYEYEVQQDIVDALRNYQSAFRAGNIGPDGFPGIYAGQMVVHPHTDDDTQWQASDWLQWIVGGAYEKDGREKAFAYGYLCHAAADIFSHTYVNWYSGDVFELADGEITNESRHIALENFISDRTPPLTNINGTSLGNAYDEGVLDTPSEFIRDHLILNDTVQKQYETRGAYHFVAVYNLKKVLEDSLPIARAIDIEIEKYIIEYYTGLMLNNEQIEDLNELAEQINERLYEDGKIEELRDLKDDLVEKTTGLVENAHDLGEDMDNALNSINQKILERDPVQEELDDLLIQLSDIQQYFIESFLDKACEAACKPLLFADCDDCNKITKTLNPDWTNLDNAIKIKEAIRDKLQEDIDRFFDDYKEAKEKLKTAAIDAIELENTTFQEIFDLMDSYFRDGYVIHNIIENWTKDIDEAMAEYVIANSLSIKEVMKESGSPIYPLIYWRDCSLPKIKGIPGELVEINCELQEHRLMISDALDAIEQILNNPLMASFPELESFLELRSQLEDRARNYAEEAFLEFAERNTDVNIGQLYDLFNDSVTEASLNSIYSSDNSGKGLLLINDIAGRVLAEMSVNSGRFNSSTYAVAYNSVILAKLALLSPEQLNKLAADAGVSSVTTYNQGQLYDGINTQPYSCLFHAVRSLDGNHQWMEIAPKYPRTDYLNKPNRSDAERRFGYARGFRIWADYINYDGNVNAYNARDQIFSRIFKFPLVPGVNMPSTIGYPDVLPQEYIDYLDTFQLADFNKRLSDVTVENGAVVDVSYRNITCNNYNLEPNSTVTFRAAKSIRIMPYFHAKRGSNFHVKIE